MHIRSTNIYETAQSVQPFYAIFSLYELNRTFEALAKYCSRHASSFNFMIMLGFFTATAMQRLFAMQTAMPGTAKVITSFAMAIKPNLPEVQTLN